MTRAAARRRATSASINGYSRTTWVALQPLDDRLRVRLGLARPQTRAARHLIVEDLADQHAVELRSVAELLGGAVQYPFRRADLAESSDGVTDTLQRVGAPNVLELDDLALELTAGSQCAPEFLTVAHLAGAVRVLTGVEAISAAAPTSTPSAGAGGFRRRA